MSKTPQRFDAVFIRKSTAGQDEQGQIDNVTAMLAKRKVVVPPERWFIGTVSRRKVKANHAFISLLGLVEEGKIGTVYVESQDRWGTADRTELYALLKILRERDTQLFDLRAGKDLTERDLATEMLAFVNSIKSQKELEDISYRSLRTRVGNFKATGRWPTGPHPFGFAKACHGADGALRWVWQPTSRTRGQQHVVSPNGKLVAGSAQIPIPPRAKGEGDWIKLIPSDNKKYVAAVKLIFDLYTRVGLSRRQISARLNSTGYLFYDKPFTHTYISQILSNPAYAGHTHFGKTQSGDLHTFNTDGIVEVVKKPGATKKRAECDRIVKLNTHEALVDSKTWKLAAAKLAAEQERVSFAPRNPAYYLKPLLVCGHCGKGMTGRTEVDPSTKERRVVYFCASYIAGRCAGQPSACGAHRITHAAAEQMLMDQVRELNLEFEDLTSFNARANLQERLEKLGSAEEGFGERWAEIIDKGMYALCQYLDEHFKPDHEAYMKLRSRALRFYWGDKLTPSDFKKLPVKLAQFTKAVKEAEAAAVAQATAKVNELQAELAAYTRNWAKADDMMQEVMRGDITRLQGEIKAWQPRTVAISQQLEQLYAAEREVQAERATLLAEWPALEAREKGEALRRLFKTVTLYWQKTFRPSEAKPSRPRKTVRAGRYSYALDVERIAWAYAPTNLGGSW